jgi:DNA-binding PadR family transcriptional regulator
MAAISPIEVVPNAMPSLDPRSQLMKGALPLLVLGALESGELYGYEIALRLGARSDGVVAPSEGSLYPTLHRLEAQGAVTAAWRASDRGPRRRYYRLTQAGHALLAQQREAWSQFSGAVDRLAVEPGRG